MWQDFIRTPTDPDIWATSSICFNVLSYLINSNSFFQLPGETAKYIGSFEERTEWKLQK